MIRDRHAISLTSIALWVGIQALMIGLIAARANLWGRGGEDAHALNVMLISQIASAAIFAPVLMRNWRTSICVVVGSLPFAQIAGAIALIETRQLVQATLASSIWLISVAVAISVARSRLALGLIHGIVLCVSVGAIALFYVGVEFADSRRVMDFAWFGPIGAVVTLADVTSSDASTRRAWIQVGVVQLLVIATLVATRSVTASAPTRE